MFVEFVAGVTNTVTVYVVITSLTVEVLLFVWFSVPSSAWQWLS